MTTTTAAAPSILVLRSPRTKANSMSRTRWSLALLGLVFVGGVEPAAAQTAAPAVRLFNRFSARCVDVKDAPGAQNVVLRQYDCAGTTSQNWSLVPVGDAFQIKSGAGLCLVPQGGGQGNGTVVVQGACGTQAAGLWQVRKTADWAVLANAQSGRCLELPGNMRDNGTFVRIWDCAAFEWQRWELHDGTAAPKAPVTLTNTFGGRCVDNKDAPATQNVVLRQYDCAGTASQSWSVTPVGDLYQVKGSAGLCLAPQAGAQPNGTIAVQVACGTPAALWQVRTTGASSEIVAPASGRCLELPGNTNDNGTITRLWDCAPFAWQRWTFPAGKALDGAGGGGTATGNPGGTGAGGTGTGGTGAGGTGGTSAGGGESAAARTVIVVNRFSARCVDVRDAPAATNVQVKQFNCDEAGSQNWTLVPVGARYQIKSIASGLCLTIQGAVQSNGIPVVQQTCGTQTSGLWTLRTLADWTEIVAADSGRCLELPGNMRDNGLGLRIWDCGTFDWQRWTLSDPALRASWSPLKPAGLVPGGAALLANGKVMLWSSDRLDAYPGAQPTTYTTVYDPVADTFAPRYVTNAGNMFCPGANILPDGRLMIAGGLSGTETSFYDPATDAWSSGSTLNISRGYNGSTTLPTGEAFTLGGSWWGGIGNKFGEVWSPATGKWRVLSAMNGDAVAGPVGSQNNRFDNHYWLFPLANGTVFHAGPSAKMFWLTTQGNGSIAPAGQRGQDPFAVNGNAVMYDAGKILKLGGAPDYDTGPALDSAYVIDITAGSGKAPTVTPTAPLAFARTFVNSVVLPTGDVVAIGGQSYAAIFNDAAAILIPELWSQKTGTFRRLPRIAVPRTYHSTALLLLDGRVLSAGGGMCGGCGVDHTDLQILTPPYLLDANGSPASRPVITAAPITAALGGTLAITTDRVATSFSLVRMSSVTHSLNADQRRVPIVPVATSGTSYQFRLPTDPGTLLPGPWMLFAMDGNGVPSVAKVVRIQ